MTTPLVDRFHFTARAGQTKTPIRAEAPGVKEADGTAVLRLYDPIDWDGGFWGVSAKEFTAVLDDLSDDITTLQVHINSPGGMVWDGLAIMNALRQHKARVVVVVDGIAASAASFIAMAGDEVVMAPGAEMMIHSPFGICAGNAQAMAKMAADLEHETDNLAGIYQSRAGGELDDWRAAMAAETWYSAEEAVAAGLADRVSANAEPEDATQAKARFDLTVFAHAGRAQAPAPTSPVASAPGRAAAGGTTTKEDAVMADTLTDGLRQRLGFADDADEATILAALDEALTEKADPPPASAAELAPAALAEVTRLSTELAELKAHASKREKDELFASWLRDGKTSKAELATLEPAYDAAPEQTAALVNARAKGSVVPVASIGTDAEGDDAAVDAEFYALFPDEKKAV